MDAGSVTLKIKSEGQSKLKADMDAAKQEVKGFGDSISSMSLAAKAGWAVAGYAVTNFVKDATQASIQFEQRFSSFTHLVSGDAEKFLDTLNLAADGTVSNLQLVTQANNAILLGIKQDQLPELLKASRLLGAAVGRTTAEAFADLTIGIGRQSRMMLDNLGIVVKAEEAYKEYADSIGKSVEELTAQERQLAFNIGVTDAIKKSTDELAGSLTDATTATQQFNKAWEDFKVKAGEPTKNILTLWLKGFNEVSDILGNIEKGREAGAQGLGEILFGKTEMPKSYTEEPEIMRFAREERERMSKEAEEAETRRFETAISSAEEVARLEQEIKDFVSKKDLAQIDNVKELAALEKLYNDRRKEGIEIMGQSFLMMIGKVKSEADEFAKYETGTDASRERARRRQEQIDAGIITPGEVS